MCFSSPELKAHKVSCLKDGSEPAVIHLSVQIFKHEYLLRPVGELHYKHIPALSKYIKVILIWFICTLHVVFYFIALFI